MRLITQHLPRLSAIALAAMLGSAHADTGPSISGDPATVKADGTAMLQLTVQVPAVSKFAAVDLTLSGWGPGLLFDTSASSVVLNSPAIPVQWSVLEDNATFFNSENTSYGLTFWLPDPLGDLPAGTYGLNLGFKWTGGFDVEVVHKVKVNVDLTKLVDDFDPPFVPLPGEREFSITVSAIPEPTPTALLLGGLAVLGWMARRRAA